MTEKLSSIEKSEHDAVISNLAKKLKEGGNLVRTNPSTSKNNPVEIDGGDYYPDVFVYKNGTLLEVYEIETKSSVSESSVEQWKKYSSDKFKFFLVVPKEVMDKAKELANAAGIKAGYWSF